MDRLRHPAPVMHTLLLAALALCLGVRVLTPAGFMPSVERGALAIVACPDGGGANLARLAAGMPAMAMPDAAVSHTGHGGHDGGDLPFHHQSCPYAAAASLAGLAGGIAVLPAILPAPLLPPAVRAYAELRRLATRERPPSRGPPPST